MSTRDEEEEERCLHCECMALVEAWVADHDGSVTTETVAMVCQVIAEIAFKLPEGQRPKLWADAKHWLERFRREIAEGSFKASVH